MIVATFRRVSLLIVMFGLASFFVATDGLANGHDHDDLVLALESDSPDRTVLTYTLEDFTRETVVINGEVYQIVGLEHTGIVTMDQVGNPQLPNLVESLMIPDTARMEVRVLEKEFYEIHGVNVAPYKGPVPRTVDPASVPYTFSEVYRQDSWFPGDLASLRDPYIMRDVRGIAVEVHPLQYNPVQKILRVHTKVKVEVVNAGPGSVNILNRTPSSPKAARAFQRLQKNHFANSNGGFKAGGGRGDPPAEDGDMLIISHGPFMAAMQPFVDWKNAIGINTTLVDVATIGNNATSIKNYVTNAYNAGNLTYLLLVGDYNEVKTPSFAGGASDPSYSTITGDWYPDLFVGRFSAQTVAHVETQVQRSIEYEQQDHDLSMGGWNTYGMGVASNQGSGIGHYGESDDTHMDLIRDELLAYGFTKVDRIYDYFGSKAMVTSGLNEGRRAVHYCGHGSTTSWGSTGFSNYDVDNLTNTGKLPFISSVACVNGNFQYGTCFAEAWMRATHNGQPAGAVACYMSSVNQSWAPPMYGQGNHGKSGKYGGAERFWMETEWSMCGEWYGGSCCMMDLAGSGGRDMFMTWICFGDPSLRVIGQAGEVSLKADGNSVSVTDPTDVIFTVCPGSGYGGYKYFLLGSATGTNPGTQLPGGVTVPLIFDTLTSLTLQNPNSGVFQNFTGQLDGNGDAVATFSTNGLTPLDPALIGQQIYFSAVIWASGYGPFDMATNVRSLTFVR